MILDQIDLTDLDFFANGDPHAAYRTLRAEAPVYWHERKPGQGFWAISKYADVLAVYHDPRTFSSARGIALNFNPAAGGEFGEGGMMMITADPPRHAKVRQIVNRRFTPRAVMPHDQHVQRITTAIIDEVIEKGACDFVTDIAARLPTAVICEMMGIPRDKWDLMFELGNQQIGAQDPEYMQGRTSMDTALQSMAEMFSVFSRLIEQRRKNPGDDLISAFAHGEVDGEKVVDLEILMNQLLLIIGGQETTRNATSGGILALLENPAEAAKLRENPALLPATIEEFLRWTSPVAHIMRTATVDTELRGRKIRAGDKVTVWNASANRDEEVFPDADKFIASRAPNDHIAFGHGEHFCLGANLARLELRVMVAEVMRRLPELELAGPVERLRSNLVAGIKHMPVRFRPAARIGAEQTAA